MYKFGFPRSTNPFASILIPTRKRVTWLRQAIDSVYSLATNKDQLEFILKVDTDDQETIDVAQDVADKINLQAIVSPRGNGYHDMHLWVNQMCEMAQGDWIILLNDDCRIVTQDWDHILLHCGINDSWHNCPEMYMLVLPTVGRPDAQEFFAVRRKVVETMGHLSLNPHNDNWLKTVMGMVNSFRHVPIFIDHFSDRIGDDIRKESVEAYKTSSPKLNTRDGVLGKLEDATKIRDYILANETKS